MVILQKKMKELAVFLGGLFLCLSLVSYVWQQCCCAGTVKSCSSESPTLASAEDAFTFVVIGDLHTGRGEEVRDVIKQHRDQINALAPDFVIGVGDLIDGPDNDIQVGRATQIKNTARVKVMWDEFDEFIKGFEVPFVRVCGNHDLGLHRDIYERRYGKTYSSFDHKGVHFIILDSEVLDEYGRPINRIAGEQLDWLRRDLAAGKDRKATFVFMHKPLWEEENYKVVTNTDWMEEVHPLLVKYGVSAVFSGHIHTYTKLPAVNGIDYYITGGGGAGVEAGNDKGEGAFHNFCHVTVRNGKHKVAVITPDGIKSDDVVLSSLNIQMGIKIPNVELCPSGEVKPLDILFYNPFDRTITTTVKFTGERNTHYKMTPESLTVSVKPGDEIVKSFKLSLDDIKYAYPSPQLKLKIEGLRGGLFESVVSTRIKHFETIFCSKVTLPIKVDGILDDAIWTDMATSSFRTPDTITEAKFPTEVCTAYDNENLYIAVRCVEPNLAGLKTEALSRDDHVYNDDSVEIFFKPVLGHKTYYQFVFNSNAVCYDGIGFDGSWNGQYIAKAGREAGAWTLETVISWKTIGMKTPKPGDKIGVEFTRFRTQAPAELTQWSPTYSHNHRSDEWGILIIK